MNNRSKKRSHAHVASARLGFTLPLWALALIGLMFLAAVGFAGVILFQVVQDWVTTAPFAVPTQVPQNSGESGLHGSPSQEEAGAGLQLTPDSSGSMPQGIRPQERVTILMMGIDQPCEHIVEPYRSDTLILLTVDPLSKTAGVLSIPRDLWVVVPGFDNNRINTAYRSGELHQYPGGGPALAVETVQLNLGVHIHHYVTVNYDGFVQAVDLIGGIELDVQEAINDPDYPDRCYGYDPFYLPAGRQHLDGDTALKFARTRATYGADFDRIERQQAVLMAIRDRVLEQNVFLLGRAGEFWNTFEENVTTNMTYQEAVGLAMLVQEIPYENILLTSVGQGYVRDYTAPDGARVLIPIREKIRELISSMFSSSGAQALPTDLQTLMQREAAEVLVLNGTYTPGLAASTADFLTLFGFTIAGVDDAQDKDQPSTRIIDYSGNPATVNYMAELMGVSPSTIFGGTDPDGEFDIKLILGADWHLPAD